MGFRSSKQRQVQNILLAFGGGVNLFDAPQAIPEGQVSQLINWLYLNREAVPSVRTGLQCIASPPASGLQLLKAHYFQKNNTDAWVVAAYSDGKLYWLDDSNAWVEIDSLSQAGVTPAMVTFNGRLIVADASQNLHYWHGRATTTSATEATVNTDAKTFVLAVDAGYLPGEKIRFVSGTASILGTVTVYTPLTKTVELTVDSTSGSGAFSSWTVSSYIPIDGSPQATAVIEAGNRLICNSAEDLDGVYFSGAEDEEMWETGSEGQASFYRAGYRDALSVVGFGLFGSDLIVFKSGSGGGRIYRINMSGSEPWEVVALSKNVTATSGNCIEWVQNNVLFGSDSGIMDIGGVIQYGDLEVGSVGKVINPILNGKRLVEIRYLANLGIALCMVEGDYRILAYHPHNGAWSILDFGQTFMLTACQAGSTVYLGGQTGYLYRLSRAEDQDELSPGNFTDYPAVLKTRTLIFEAEEVIRQTRLYHESLTDAVGTVSYLGLDSPDPRTLIDINTLTGLGQLYDATGLLADANEQLGAFTVDYTTSWDRARDPALAFEIKIISGRIKARQIYTSVATVNG